MKEKEKEMKRIAIDIDVSIDLHKAFEELCKLHDRPKNKMVLFLIKQQMRLDKIDFNEEV